MQVVSHNASIKCLLLLVPGKVGGGDPELTAELSREIDEWIEVQLQNTDLRFPDKK